MEDEIMTGENDMTEISETKIVHDSLGYLRLDPIPTQEELDVYYRNQYFKLAGQGNRAPEIGRQLAGRDKARKEVDWLEKTLYYDLRTILENFTQGRRLLDIGCGTGAFLRYMSKRGWTGTGVEPSEEGARLSGLVAHNMPFTEFCENPPHGYDAITLINVLEHVANPLQEMEMVASVLNPGGIVGIRVPNDFSLLQSCANRQSAKKQWWVTTPDHINYFSFLTLENLIGKTRLKVVHRTTDFPMEIFLLMGDDYVNDPAQGDKCHDRRKNLEMALPSRVRRNLYRNLAKVGIGRSCIVFAKKEDE